MSVFEAARSPPGGFSFQSNASGSLGRRDATARQASAWTVRGTSCGYRGAGEGR